MRELPQQSRQTSQYFPISKGCWSKFCPVWLSRKQIVTTLARGIYLRIIIIYGQCLDIGPVVRCCAGHTPNIEHTFYPNNLRVSLRSIVSEWAKKISLFSQSRSTGGSHLRLSSTTVTKACDQGRIRLLGRSNVQCLSFEYVIFIAGLLQEPLTFDMFKCLTLGRDFARLTCNRS